MRNWEIATVIGTYLCVLSAPALAQSANQAEEATPRETHAEQRSRLPAAAETGPLTEIVVTAQKRSENLQRVPITVTAIGGQTLSNNHIALQTALPRVTPNLTFTAQTNFIAPYIRGVGSQFALPGLEQSVATYFDDQYMPRSSSGLLSFNDIDHIEVLKGPQGTLYGRNATGGAIRIITRDPVNRFEGSADVAFGSFAQKTFEGVINIPITPHLAFRVAAQHDENEGYVKNIIAGQPRLNSRNQEFVRAKLLWTPTDRLTVKLSGDYVDKNDRDGMAFLPLYGSGPEQIGIALGGQTGNGFYKTASDLPRDNKARLKAGGIALRVDYDINGAKISSITGYRYNRYAASADLDTTSLFFQHSNVPEELTRDITQEFQIVSNGNGPFSYVAGFFFLHEYALSKFGVIGDAVGPGTFLGTVGSIKVDSFAPYGQLSYDLTDRLQITAGLRYTSERKRLLGNYGYIGPADEAGPIAGPIIIPPIACTLPATPGVLLCTSNPRSVRFHRLTPKITVSFKPSRGVMLYASYSSGFKSGGFNLPTFGTVDSVNPEKLDAFEIGSKVERGRIRFNSAAFLYNYKDLQVAITDQTTGGTRTVNAASARIWGIETEVTIAPSHALELGFGGGYLHSQYRKYIGDAYIPCNQIPANTSCISSGGLGLALVPDQNFSGNRLVNAPKWTGYARLQYEIPFVSESKFRLNLLGNYQSKLFYDPANLYSERARFLLSGAFGWSSKGDRFQLTVFGDNLTDRKYSTNKSPQTTGGWYIPAPPRTIGVRFGVKFG